VNTIISSPVPRLFAPLAALMLVSTGCGLPGSSPEEENVSVESPEAEEDGARADDENDSPATGALAGPGILAADCDGPEGWVEYTLFSPDGAEELAHARFDVQETAPGESGSLSHGRAVAERVALDPTCSEGYPAPLFPERHLVMVTFEEEVNGNRVNGFGVQAEDGTFTALSPEQEVADFGTPVDYLYPVADPEQDRIVFVQDEGGSEHGIHAMDLESGEITDLGGTCAPLRCDRLTVVPGIDGAVLYENNFTSMAVIEDGEGLIGSIDGNELRYYDLSDQIGDGVVDLTSETLRHIESSPVPVGKRVSFQPLGNSTLLFADDELSVVEFTADTPDTYESENEGALHHELEPLPTERTLVPAGTRENTDPVVSPDGSEVLFRSEPPTGGFSWYRVPADGSGDPVEFSELPGDLHRLLAWT
jgi:hypothetical protein